MTSRNRLASATSPYLLQHADNPVHWWPWSDEAFAEAAKRQVPVFLSVGYAACHWCHVMAHESFEDQQTASMINDHFIAIKVDREERPDVDAIYMQATQALTGQGGWPMTVFLTPDRRPFYAGTYFPPAPRHGLPSFMQVLRAISDAWRDRRSELLVSAAEIVRQLSQPATLPDSGELTEADCEKALLLLQGEFDATYGGFGRAPKFPPSMVLEALLRDGGDPAMLMAGRTLEAMARGGIYDQIGGGFARYSVDAGWVVPHFEKMLYDNALLLGAYTHWWRRTRNPLAERIVAETVEWLLREMRTKHGAFTSSLDADSKDDHGELREGAYYTWNRDQLRAALGEEDAAWAAEAYSVTPTGTFEHGASTLQLLSDHDQLRLADVRDRLRIAREQRSRPGRDDKVVAAWNALLVDALAQAAVIFARPDWLEIATEAAEHVWRVHWRDGRLRRTSRAGVAGPVAILEDYAALALAAVRLASIHAAPAWLSRAEQLLEVIMEQFDDAGRGFFDTAADAERLYARPQDPTDNATPSGLSTSVHALRLMAELTGEDRYAGRADRAAASSAELVRRAPRFAGWLLADAISQTSGRGPVQVAVVGPDDTARAELVRVAHQLAPAGSVVVPGSPDQPGLALLADRPMINNQATAYVCRQFLCRLPVTSADDLALQLESADTAT
ncbi:MAG TPA: thioredoxin domain-containing protein [Propionibacteriaceae bacterium]|nr:thioredoxin domain-containing protein [Propionibacteriaceae bacterium]